MQSPPNGLQKLLEGAATDTAQRGVGSIICSQVDHVHCTFVSYLVVGHQSSQGRRDAAETGRLLLNGDEWSGVSSATHRSLISVDDSGLLLTSLEYNAALKSASSSTGLIIILKEDKT